MHIFHNTISSFCFNFIFLQRKRHLEKIVRREITNQFHVVRESQMVQGTLCKEFMYFVSVTFWRG